MINVCSKNKPPLTNALVFLQPTYLDGCAGLDGANAQMADRAPPARVAVQVINMPDPTLNRK